MRFFSQSLAVFLLLSVTARSLPAQSLEESRNVFGFKVVLRDVTEKDVRVGAARTEIYLPYLQHQKVAVCANHTACVGNTHLVDTLHSLGVKIVKIFAPEHGFRGESEAGKSIADGVDVRTGIPIVSLYGSHKKPTAEDLSGVDVVLFDIQDVGARFYTYISTLHYLMEAAAENNVKVVVLDRPNPNGFWVDGPVLDPKYASFVGMDPIPIVHGMTVGEYARMLNGEGWLKNGVRCSLQVVNVLHYDHALRYQLPKAPSPNLPTMEAVYLYPTLCLFEGTPLSVGRGTGRPFCILGYPSFQKGTFSFRPKSIAGVATHPPFENRECRGLDLTDFSQMVLKNNPFIHLDLLIEMYNSYPEKDAFFTSMFVKLAGDARLQKQIQEGRSASEIRDSWKNDLEAFKKIRKKYLLYPDFE